MIPVPLISPVQFYLKVFTCVVLGKEPVFIFLVVRTTKRPQTRWTSSLESWVHLKRAPNTLACQTLHWLSCSSWHVCHHSWFHPPSIQTSTDLSCTCNQNQLTWGRGELFGLETCSFGQRPCRVWITDPYSLLMWEISLWFVLKYIKNTPIWEVYRQTTEQKVEHQVVWTQLNNTKLYPDLSVLRAMLSDLDTSEVQWNMCYPVMVPNLNNHTGVMAGIG